MEAKRKGIGIGQRRTIIKLWVERQNYGQIGRAADKAGTSVRT